MKFACSILTSFYNCSTKYSFLKQSCVPLHNNKFKAINKLLHKLPLFIDMNSNRLLPLFNQLKNSLVSKFENEQILIMRLLPVNT